MSDDSTSTSRRVPTAIDAIAERWVDTLVDLDPSVATWIGREGRTGEYGDYSPEGHDRRIGEARAVIAALDAAPVVDNVDRVTQTDLRGELALDTDFVNESFIGSRFIGRLIAETDVDGRPAVIPTITGRAWVTGTGQYMLDPADPFPTGFTF